MGRLGGKCPSQSPLTCLLLPHPLCLILAILIVPIDSAAVGIPEVRPIDETEIVSLEREHGDGLAAFDDVSHSEWYNYYVSDAAKSFREARIGEQSWAAYQRFKEETCRPDEGEVYTGGRILNSSGSDGYFKWESEQFHRELRKIILPETRDGSFSSLVGSRVLGELDSRLFVSTPESLCKAKREDSEKAAIDRDEKDRFEDYLINKIVASDPDELPVVRRNTSASELTSSTTTVVIRKAKQDEVVKQLTNPDFR